jgi:hypothetical protein
MMVHRKSVPAYNHCTIGLTTEEMKDGGWAVVVTVTQSTDGADRHVDLPVTHHRFDSEAEAERYGISAAREWIDQNTPRVA